MNQDDKAHLDLIMTSFKERLAKSKDAQEQRQSEEDGAYEEFKRVRAETIRPAMEDIGQELKAAGHEYEIIEVADGRSQRDARITLAVTIIGIPTSAHRRDNKVSVSFYRTGATAVTIQAETQIKKNMKSVAGQRGNYDASDITTDFVQKEILTVLEEVFRAM
ncbi:MAG: hypothetical protein NVSMB52_11040 [Chloroflexota bacterium]